MNIINKIFFSTIILLQVYLLVILNFIAVPTQLIFVFVYGIFSFYKPLWSLSLFFALLPLTGIDSIQTNDSYIIGFSATLLLGIYSDLLFKLPVRFKRFLVKTRLNNILLVLILMYVVSLFFGLLNQPIYSLYYHLFTLHDPMVLIELFNVTPDSELYPLKSTLIILQSIFFGLYVFGIVKPSNQVRILHHLILALVFGLVLSLFIASLNYFSILEANILYMEPYLFSQYLIITLPLLPVILLLHKMNMFYFTLIALLVIIGGTSLILAMQLTAFLTYPFIFLVIWLMIYFILVRIKNKHSTLLYFIKSNWHRVLISLIVSLLTTTILAFTIKTHFQPNTLSNANVLEVYLEKQNDRSESWALGTSIFVLNPLYGTGINSFQWKAKKLQIHNNKPTSLDNLYLVTVLGSGVVGLIFFISFLAVIFYRLLKKEFSSIYTSIEVSILGLMVLGSLASTLIYANIANIFDFYPVLIIFWLIIFIGISLIHRYHIRQQERYRIRKFFHYISYIIFYLLFIHILNFTVIKEYFSELISSALPFFQEENSVILISYLSWIMVIGGFSSFIMHSKVILYSNKDNLLVDEYGTSKTHAIHNTAIPRAGGIGIYFTNLFLIFNPIGWKLFLISLPAFIIGFIDDIKSITPKVRLLFQSLSAILAVLILNTLAYSIGFEIFLPYWLSILISIFAIIGVTNALNIIDGFNGLASGIALMIFISLAFISFIVKDMVLFEIIFINIIALVGFLILNFPKGKIFLGDGGAYFIGFSLATVSLLVTYTHREISVFYPLALLIYPVWEVVFSIYRRKIIKKVQSTHPDRIHLHQLIYRRIVKSNPKTTVYIWKRVFPFMLLATYFYNNDALLLLIILAFILAYNFSYRKIVKNLMTIK
ncbi:MAG: MraY family glycosyltransferase [Patescibacteria group bacterium]|nr:MraY family glycosyltransferase [Patescibacteria group bacterium]